MRTTLLLPLLFLLMACTAKNAAEESKRSMPKEGLSLPAGSPMLDYLKLEVARESTDDAVVSLTGRVTFNEEKTQRVSSPIDGRVRAILVRPGDRVKPGQALVQLTSPQVAQLLADAQKSDQEFGISQKAVDRATRLRADGAISDKDLAQVNADLKKAQAEVTRTKGQLRMLGILPTEATFSAALHAEFAGTVVERNVLVGQEVRADATLPLLTVTDLSTVWVMADVYEQDLALVRNGAPVAVRVQAWPGDSFPGVVQYVGDVVDPSSRTVKVRCTVPNPDGRLKPEMFAKVDLKDVEGRKFIVLPAKAVLSDGDKAQVVVSAANNLFTLRTIEIGSMIDGKVRVLKGLTPGETVITDGALFAKQELLED